MSSPNRVELASWPPPAPNQPRMHPARRMEQASHSSGRLLVAHGTLWCGLVALLLALEPISAGLLEVFTLDGGWDSAGFAAAQWVLLTLPLVAAILVLGRTATRTVLSLTAVVAVVALNAMQATVSGDWALYVVVGALTGGLVAAAWICVRRSSSRELGWVPVAMVLAGVTVFWPTGEFVVDHYVLGRVFAALSFLSGPVVTAWLAAITDRNEELS